MDRKFLSILKLPKSNSIVERFIYREGENTWLYKSLSCYDTDEIGDKKCQTEGVCYKNKCQVFSAESSDTSYEGCGIKSAQNVLRYFDIFMTQDEIKKYIKTHSIKSIKNNAWVYPDEMTSKLQKILNDNGYKDIITVKRNEGKHKDKDFVLNTLKAELPLIALVDKGSHYISIFGYRNGKYCVHDNSNNTLRDKIDTTFDWKAKVVGFIDRLFDNNKFKEGTFITFHGGQLDILPNYKITIEKQTLENFVSQTHASYRLVFSWECDIIPYYRILIDGKYNSELFEYGNTRKGSASFNLSLPRTKSEITIEFREFPESSYTFSKSIEVDLTPQLYCLPYFNSRYTPSTSQQICENDTKNNTNGADSHLHITIQNADEQKIKLIDTHADRWIYIYSSLLSKDKKVTNIGCVITPVYADFKTNNLAEPIKIQGTVEYKDADGKSLNTFQLDNMLCTKQKIFDGFLLTGNFQNTNSVTLKYNASDNTGQEFSGTISFFSESIIKYIALPLDVTSLEIGILDDFQKWEHLNNKNTIDRINSLINRELPSRVVGWDYNNPEWERCLNVKETQTMIRDVIIATTKTEVLNNIVYNCSEEIRQTIKQDLDQQKISLLEANQITEESLSPKAKEDIDHIVNKALAEHVITQLTKNKDFVNQLNVPQIR